MTLANPVKEGRFVLIDGSSLFYRAFYALPDLTNSKGEHTNAIHGFASMLVGIIQEFKPQYLGVAFDKGRRTFRNKIFADYKGTRDKTPEELLVQIPLLKELVAAYGLPFLELDEYEADDIIGTIAVKAAAHKYDTIVVTGDKDALQLIRPNLRVAMTKKGISEHRLYDEALFTEEYGIAPIVMIDLKGLMGDSSDNIPGVPKVGIKTGTKLLQKYGTLEAVLDNASNVSGKKLQESLAIYRDQALLSKTLATIELGVPNIEFDPEHFIPTPDSERMRAFCVRYDLNSAWRAFERLVGKAADIKPDKAVADSRSKSKTYSIEGALFSDEELAVTTSADSEQSDILRVNTAGIIEAMRNAYLIGVTGEFDGKLPDRRLVALAVTTLEKDKDNSSIVKQAWITADDSGYAKAMEIIGSVATDNESKKSLSIAELKSFYHAGVLENEAVNCLEIALADYLIQPENNRRDYRRMAMTYLQELNEETSFTDSSQRLLYESALLTRLYNPVKNTLTAKALDKLYSDMELPLVRVLARMELAGIKVNRQRLEELLHSMNEWIASIEQDIYSLAGGEFNINSPKQLGEILFEKLGLQGTKKTKSGYSTNAEVLESLQYQHPIVGRILDYRRLAKLRSTYLEGIVELIIPPNDRVHTSFNQMVTATGRLSSSDPNLQNIPVRTEEGRAIRTLFEPGDGYDALLSADYSQIELRLLAHMSGDPTFIDAFCKNQDIHARTASEVFGVPLEEVSAEERRRAKAVNFGIVYGISDFGLSRDLHISKKEAADYIEGYFTRYSGVKDFLDKTVELAHTYGYVTTIFGRRRDLAAINSRNYLQRSLAERMAMNTPIQGSAADIIKLAMIAAAKALDEAGLKSHMLLQVHDELVLEITNEEYEQVAKILKQTMENVIKLSVPLVIDIHYGANWAEAK